MKPKYPISRSCFYIFIILSIVLLSSCSFSSSSKDKNNSYKRYYDSPPLSQNKLNFNRGLKEVKAGNHKKAYELILPLAKSGEPKAEYVLGLLYEEGGKGLPQNFQEAQKWYLRAANKGHAKAQIQLGTMNRNGKGIPKNLKEAEKWFRKAAKQLNRSAVISLGIMITLGEAEAIDPEESFFANLTLAEEGYLPAQLKTAEAFYYGVGVPKNYELALEWFRKAANYETKVLKNYELALIWVGEVGVSTELKSKAQARLGMMHFDGIGVPQDYGKAREWLEKAAKQGQPMALSQLGTIYYLGKGVPPDYRKAAEAYFLAAKKGSLQGLVNLGVLYFQGKGVPQNHQKAFEIFQIGADFGSSHAQASLAEVYATSKDVPKDPVQGYKWATLALPTAHDTDRADILKLQSEFKKELTPAQITETEKLAREWRSKPWPEFSKEVNSYFGVSSQPQNTRSQAKLSNPQNTRPQTKTEIPPINFKAVYAAAILGNVDAQNVLSMMFFSGTSAPQDRKRAAKWMLNAAEQGHAQAQTNLGGLYGSGKGLSQDWFEGYKWVTLALKTLPNGETRQLALKLKSQFKSQLQSAQIKEAEQWASEWKPKTWEELSKKHHR